MHIVTPTKRAAQYWEDKEFKKWIVTLRVLGGFGRGAGVTGFQKMYIRARDAKAAADTALSSFPGRGYPRVSSVQLADPVTDLGGELMSIGGAA